MKGKEGSKEAIQMKGKKDSKEAVQMKGKKGSKEAVHESKMKELGIKERNRIQPWIGGIRTPNL